MKKNTLFRGCTRPPMFMGVPYVPFFIGAGIPLLFAMYFNLFYLLAIPVIIMILRQIAKQDEMFFRLWGLKLLFLFQTKNRSVRKGLSVTNPNIYRKTPSKTYNG